MAVFLIAGKAATLYVLTEHKVQAAGVGKIKELVNMAGEKSSDLYLMDGGIVVTANSTDLIINSRILSSFKNNKRIPFIQGGVPMYILKDNFEIVSV